MDRLIFVEDSILLDSPTNERERASLSAEDASLLPEAQRFREAESTSSKFLALNSFKAHISRDRLVCDTDYGQV